MAKDKPEKEAKIDKDAPYRVSGQLLYEARSKRDIVTGCLSLDAALGGGFPMGCTSIIGGASKRGKSSVALQYSAFAQNLYGCKIFFFAVEGRIDNRTFNQIRGLDLNKVEIILGPPILGKDGEVVGNRKMSAETWWKLIGQCIEQNPGAVIIVDSISALSNESELAEGMGYQSRGRLQQLEAQFCRTYADLIMPNRILLILLAQVQANTSGYGDSELIKCGNAIRHAADAILHMRTVERWKPTAEGKILGHTIGIKIAMSPLGPPWVECKTDLRYGYGLDNEKEIIDNAVNLDYIKMGGAGWYTLPFITAEGKFKYTKIEDMTKDYEPVKIQGEENVRQWLIANQKEYKILEKEIRKLLFG